MATQKERLAPALETEGLDEAAAAEPGRTSALAALEYRDFRLFWIGLVVSNIGTWMQQFGLGWLVVQLAIKDGVPHLAPFYLGLVGLSRAVPGLAFGLFGGAVADRADRRRLLLVTQTSAAIVAAILAALTISEHINIVEIVLLSAMNSIIFSFDAPSRQAMVPRLVSDRELMSAIGLNSAAFNGATLVGPLLGGVLIIPFGVGGRGARRCPHHRVARRLAASRGAPRGRRPRARGTSYVLRRPAFGRRRDGLRGTHEPRGDGLPRDGEHPYADPDARRDPRAGHEREHDGLHGLHAARPDAARIGGDVRRDQQRVPRGRCPRDAARRLRRASRCRAPGGHGRDAPARGRARDELLERRPPAEASQRRRSRFPRGGRLGGSLAALAPGRRSDAHALAVAVGAEHLCLTRQLDVRIVPAIATATGSRSAHLDGRAA